MQVSYVMAKPIVAGSRRRYCREEITMLGGWEAGIALLPDAGGGVEDG